MAQQKEARQRRGETVIKRVKSDENSKNIVTLWQRESESIFVGFV
jgi:hypothetical protein